MRPADRFDAAFPTRRPLWPVRGTDRAGTRWWGTWDVGTDAVARVDPSADDRLPGLREWLPRGTLVAYRPGRRAVVRVEVPGGPPRWVKLVRPTAVADLVARHVAAAGALAGTRIGVPLVLDAEPDRGVVVLTSVAGDPLVDAVGSSGGDLAVRTVGAALADLSASGAAWVRPDGGAVDAAAERGPLEWAEWSGSATRDPAVAAALRDAAAVLPAAPDPCGIGTAAVHGDLHEGNVFLSAVGGGPVVSLIDLDGAGIGEPGRDLANLSCHLVLGGLVAGDPCLGRRRASALVEAFAEAGGEVDVEALARLRALTFHRLACVHVHRRATRHLWHALLELAAGSWGPASESRNLSGAPGAGRSPERCAT